MNKTKKVPWWVDMYHAMVMVPLVLMWTVREIADAWEPITFSRVLRTNWHLCEQCGLLVHVNNLIEHQLPDGCISYRHMDGTDTRGCA